ncbi:MAG TPA: VOC family protein [Candidatus Dormibacteraeota bacterium]|nr:VOC family protein [Candidatus Dormibacteraeota bacterium]
MLEIDHVLIAVGNLDSAADRLRDTYGLESVEGGRHPGWGTANRIVPLGGEYLELIGVVDPDEASASPFGSWLMERVEDGDHLLRCCLRPSDLSATAERLGADPLPGSRVTDNGHSVHWRLVGLEAAMSDNLPFFIEWHPESPHPGHTRVEHPSGALGIAWVEIGGDRDRLRDWLGDDAAAIHLVGGQPGVRRVGIITPEGDIVLR